MNTDWTENHLCLSASICGFDDKAAAIAGHFVDVRDWGLEQMATTDEHR